MKNLFYILYTFIYRLLHPFLKGITFSKAYIWMTEIHIQGFGNSLIFDKCHIGHSDYSIFGDNNSVKCSGVLHKNHISIEGSSNTVIIEPECNGQFSVCVKGSNCVVRIGKGTTSNSVQIVCMGKGTSVILGEDCMLSENVEIWNTDTHYILDKISNTPINYNKSIKIGKHVWLGRFCTVLKGVSIGDEAIIGTYTVVTKDIPNNSICVGNPGTIKKTSVTWDRKQAYDI